MHVDVDDDTILTNGETDQLADVLAVLDRLNASAILVDIIMTSGVPAVVRERLARLETPVYYPIILRSAKDLSVSIESPIGDELWEMTVSSRGRPQEAQTAYYPARDLVESAEGLGHINIQPDIDGVYRRVALLMRYGEGYIPGIAFRVVSDFLGIEPGDMEVQFGRSIILKDGLFPDSRATPLVIPIDREGRLRINYVGPWGDSHHHYSSSRILDAAEHEENVTLLREELEGSIIVFSDVSTFGRDLGPMPIEDVYPLSGIHSNVINSILTGTFIREATFLQELATDLFIAVVLFFLSRRMGRLFGISSILLLVLFLLYGVSVFLIFGVFCNLVRPSLFLVLAVGILLGKKYIHEERRRVSLRAKLENYFAPAIMDKIVGSNDLIQACENKELTILFSDIAGFSEWSSRRKAQDIRSALNRYFEQMAEIVFLYDGTVDKYIGDGMLAFFGDPIEHEDHVLRAAKAALKMQRRCRELTSDSQESSDGLPLRIRIGIDTGEVAVGNMGSPSRIDYTVIGANVNLAQRLEAAAPIGGILVSEAVKRVIADSITLREFDGVELKGFPEIRSVYEIVVD